MILVTSERTSWSTWHSPEHLTCVGSAVVCLSEDSRRLLQRLRQSTGA
jgi:hypothetical protein